MTGKMGFTLSLNHAISIYPASAGFTMSADDSIYLLISLTGRIPGVWRVGLRMKVS